MKKSGIYQILNLINQKCYIGSSKDISHRWCDHKRQLRSNKHGNKHLQNAWNKDGENMFIFHILEIVDNPTKEILESREDYWIEHFNSIEEGRGYNKQKATRGSFSEKWKNNSKKIIAKTKDKNYFLNRKSLQHIPEPTKELIAENLEHYSLQGYIVKIDSYSKTLKVTIKEDSFEKIVYLKIEPYQVISEPEFNLINNPHVNNIVELNTNLELVQTFNQTKEVLEKYPHISRNQLEILLYCPIKYNRGKPTVMKTAKGKIFLTEQKYLSLKESNQLQEYFKRKEIPRKKGSRRYIAEQKRLKNKSQI